MNIILLSGGSGKRLWPLSNEIRSKQFIQMFKNESGEYESMVQRVYNQICEADPNAKITIATSKTQVSAIHNQLGEGVGICVEPFRKDTFPAIVLATAYLRDVEGLTEDEVVVVCPVDPYVENSYFKSLKKMEDLIKKNASSLVLMGVEPTYPSEKYGYIIPTDTQSVSKVSSFKEKPGESEAQKYIEQGALWNGGVFCYKIGYVLDKARSLIDFTNYDDLLGKYESLDKISFDYAVVEKENDIQVMRFSGEWKDLGTWNTLTEVMEENGLGDTILDESCENLHVINELDVPVLCMGVKNMIVSASPEGILVSDKKQSSFIKPFVDKINQRIMFAEKSWGSFRVLDIQEESMTIRVLMYPGHRMNYHSHERRDEVWTIISGEGRTVVDGMEQRVRAGDVITMQAGSRHTIISDTELRIIEVQLGKEISVHDKQKFELE